ncbi:MAG: two-component system, OmpR family, osmolarity sensor histidine kinase EnvZ [Solirubrobacterales bacterium]|jgi:signal transduction histidine kinase|nr:two-component system, OmpR family, osmolarity sensor histidine kinase EnvZ [Solirubrobacterales bacterium]
MTELAQIVAGWPLVFSMAAAVAAQSLRAGRRRIALNEALHELRRPLQAVALAAGPGIGGPGHGRDSMELAATALERLDREINGGPPTPVWGSVDGASLIQSAVARWQARVQLADGSLEMRWNAGHALLRGDRHALGQALDNLIVNAIDHGGPTIVVAGRLREGHLRIAVVDSGRATRPRSRSNSPAQVIARLSGQQRHGHGLTVVRRVAADHGGRFALRHSERGSLAVLELPLAEPETGLAA